MGGENPPWLSSQRPKMYHEQAVSYFFTHATADNSNGMPLRYHMSSGRVHVYGAIIEQDLRANPGAHYVVFIPQRGNVRTTALGLRNFDLKVACVGNDQVFEQADFNVLVCSYESAPMVNGQSFRIKFVEEPILRATVRTNLHRLYETDVKRGVDATYVVHFAPSEADAEQS